MKGIAVIKGNSGEPTVLTIDLKAHNPTIQPLVEALMKIVNEDDERLDFYQDSLRMMERAYGPDEPEYTDDDLI